MYNVQKSSSDGSTVSAVTSSLRLIRLVSALLCLVLLQTSSANFTCKNDKKQNSYLWRIETTPPVYLYGTLHISYKRMWYDIPENVKKVFSNSKHFCVELRLTDPGTLQNLSKCRFLPKKIQISDVLPKDLYIRITKYLLQVQMLFPKWINGNKTINGFDMIKSNQLFESMISGWTRQRPIWLLMLLSSLSEENIKERGVPLLDIFMDKAAAGMGKDVEAMENFKEQCRPFNRLNLTQVTVALRKQLDYLEPLVYNGNGPNSNTDSNLETYHCGDFLNLVKSTPILPLPSNQMIPNLTNWEADILNGINEYLTKQLAIRRNRRMTKKITSILSKPRNETYLFALGAGHLLGTKSIVHMLQKKNYKVTLVPIDQEISGSPLPKNIINLGDPSSQPKIISIPTNSPTMVTTKPTGSLPTLSPHIVTSIIQKAINGTTLFKIDSVEVTPSSSYPSSSSVSPSLYPSPSPSSQVLQNNAESRGLTMAKAIVQTQQLQEVTDDTVPPSLTNSSVRWTCSYTSLTISFIIVLSLIFNLL